MDEHENAETASTSKSGRKLDESRDAAILEAALDVLAETGYTGMTMALVAARAKAGKGAMYRRWASKEDLVIDAVRHMARRDVDIDALPDTGSLRDDILALILPESLEETSKRLRILAGLASMATVHEGIGEAVTDANVGEWITANRILIQRAIDRGEGRPDARADALARVIPAMCAARSGLEGQPITAEFITALLDDVLLPAVLAHP
ncbi:TetR/AcrR family transcriptional regulator C-terminal ligand-binding domain-containing protein [Kribbella sp. NPDC056861]|uniref:TetR/AcrR family transcriptional regulator n=1 Tax=Kribbella sp. NPDC056861 TaxID=3154857 RepID=UPI00341AFD06